MARRFVMMMKMGYDFSLNHKITIGNGQFTRLDMRFAHFVPPEAGSFALQKIQVSQRAPGNAKIARSAFYQKLENW